MAAFDLLAAVVCVPAVALFFFAFTCITTAALSASPDHYVTRNFDVYDPKPFPCLYPHVPCYPQTDLTRQVCLGNA